ncbi:MAG: winged helix-turn-helix transcriptional regulator, partial [Treponemataceae bacterium]|nr:winged helix-turn-helix transcriptional regulator [Treponemataceae bacterium]
LLMGERNELKNRFCNVRAENLPVNASVAEKSGEILPANLPVNKTQRAILALLLENNRASDDELAETLGKTRETVRSNLRILEKNGLVERIGADKNGYWKIALPRE